MRKTLKPIHAGAAGRRRLWWGATHVHNGSNGASGTDGEAAAYAAATSESYGFLNIFFQNNQLIITCLSEEQAVKLVNELKIIAIQESMLCGAEITQIGKTVTVTQPVDTALWTALQQDKESHLTRQTTPYVLITCIQRIKSSLAIVPNARTPTPPV